jgi:hypothetical protein
MSRTDEAPSWLRRLARTLTRPDILVDLHIYGGLAFAAWGGWQLSQPWTAIALGLTLAALPLGHQIASAVKARQAGQFSPVDALGHHDSR